MVPLSFQTSLINLGLTDLYCFLFSNRVALRRLTADISISDMFFFLDMNDCCCGQCESLSLTELFLFCRIRILVKC